MIPLPAWMRRTLFVTAVMNIGAAAIFLPAAASLRAIAGLPEGGHPFYLQLDALFILLFGLGYLWAAVSGRAERLFIAIAAAGKLSFFGLVVVSRVAGEVPSRAPALASADLIFGVLFLLWLFNQKQNAGAGRLRLF